jgi:hypothetical protein
MSPFALLKCGDDVREGRAYAVHLCRPSGGLLISDENADRSVVTVDHARMNRRDRSRAWRSGRLRHGSFDDPFEESVGAFVE